MPLVVISCRSASEHLKDMDKGTVQITALEIPAARVAHFGLSGAVPDAQIGISGGMGIFPQLTAARALIT
jgi:hypothetical protein